MVDRTPNQLIISIQPEMEITLLFHAKEPGVKMQIKPVEMDFTYKESYDEPVPEAYETLLLEALDCDASFFMRADQVEAAWKVVTPILDSWKQGSAPRFPNYKPGSWGPKAAETLMKRDGRSWILLPEENNIQKNTLKKNQ